VNDRRRGKITAGGRKDKKGGPKKENRGLVFWGNRGPDRRNMGKSKWGKKARHSVTHGGLQKKKGLVGGGWGKALANGSLHMTCWVVAGLKNVKKVFFGVSGSEKEGKARGGTRGTGP